jgi:hypothetical protein
LLEWGLATGWAGRDFRRGLGFVTRERLTFSARGGCRRLVTRPFGRFVQRGPCVVCRREGLGRGWICCGARWFELGGSASAIFRFGYLPVGCLVGYGVSVGISVLLVRL